MNKNILFLLVVSLSNQKAFFGDATTVSVRSLNKALGGIAAQMAAQRASLGIGKRTNRTLIDTLEEDSVITPNPLNQNVLYLKLMASVTRMTQAVPAIQGGGSSLAYSFEARQASISLRGIRVALGGRLSSLPTHQPGCRAWKSRS